MKITWTCKTCGCRWRDNGDETVSLLNMEQKSCAECEGKPTYEACEGVCEHGTALDVHCCNCHSGYIFDEWHICGAPHEQET